MKFFRRNKDKRKASGGGSAIAAALPGFGYSPNRPALGAGLDDGSRNPYPSYGHGRNDSNGPWASQYRSMATRASAMTLANLPAPILERIFTFVCPHSRDTSYETCEASSIEDACMLCDLRDLAHCLAVCKRWRKGGANILYYSIRIDQVHYCDREAELAELRKRKTRFDRNGEPEDTAQARLKLLCRTLREDPVRLGRIVEYFKTPYMLRESCQADLARTIAVTPNLKYVDLPEGLFSDEPSFMTLRLEVQARCLHLRKMTYMNGAEHSLQMLATGKVWPNLEVLELVRIEVDPAMLRQVLGCLGNLRALKITDTTCITDETLAWNDMLPPFPPLEELILTNVPNVTTEGLRGWLVDPNAQSNLRVITLNGTGVFPWALQEFLPYAPKLKHLSVIDTVAQAVPAAQGQYFAQTLASTSIHTLHYEITAHSSVPKYSGITASYYSFLAASLLTGGLPNLQALYVRDPNFPDLLLGLPPPSPGFAGAGMQRPSSSGSNRNFSPHRGMGSMSASPGSGFHQHQGSLSSFAPPSAPFVPGHRQFGSVSSVNSFSGFLGPGGGKQPPTNHRFSSNNPFANLAAPAGPGSFANLPAKLEVFTKGDDDTTWSFAKVGGGAGPVMSSGGRGGGYSGTGERPQSGYGLGADLMGGNAAAWGSGGGARRSVLIGGAGAGGGFLALPAEDPARNRGGSVDRGTGGFGGGGGGGGGGDEELWPRPKSSAGVKKNEKLDLWR
ncbi:hypothetical protein SMACR_06645 [Sordaria macrospora]|uniref:WGS project CABT00000000 data, contig 2.37 n=2 Tax=Sordaria macrospora TaxID=5147 RepID=F7W765_SORMK|nr:uncharacterized protein SMAC_06645 [Sordaria macrospora k-hell]KAA8633736.1 hypothetical protein SMACR_06645 [Sordaria macrospora]KAH7633509.1 hypothetical protein B0T09DRAFT_93151 [Sordaria sp. MPI-SDFR-AT-0083]WPJ60094.1 hypothetical protein SMAC4_06645 [Sordaria macrospora]CCC13356.1 unnamed protein product [Sordaria macrospora k-hell]